VPHDVPAIGQGGGAGTRGKAADPVPDAPDCTAGRPAWLAPQGDGAAGRSRTAWHPRRVLFAALVAVLVVLLLWLALRVLAPDGWTAWEILLLLCLAVNAPWLALAGATGLLGGAIRLSAGNPAAIVVPLLRAIPAQAPIRHRTVIAVCIRDEDMAAVLPPLARLLDALAPQAAWFGLAILSDTADGSRAVAEAEAVSRFAATRPAGQVLYRRRMRNAGYKAGNVMDFLDHHAAGFSLMLLLDADSEMSAEAVLRMVRVMQADPRLGILQSTIASRPAVAPFGRLLGFGHRPGSLTWATGQAWWQGGEGPFWGHNALIRIAPFRAHARLSPLPDGSHILSHDHVEAARLHAAGWSVQVLPDPDPEGAGSRESHPPNLPEFLVRDRRWAAGNMQYRYLLSRPDLGALGRFQMLQAILHYALAPAWFALLPLAVLNATTGAPGTPRGALLALVALGCTLLNLPRLAGHAEALLRGPAQGRFRYLRDVAAESLFLLLFDALLAFDRTLTVLAQLLGRKRQGWVAQHRAERRVGWREATGLLWPHTAIGCALLAPLAVNGSGFALVIALPALAGLVLAIPFCVLTSRPDRG
jgi:membrane glycosyltransferase